MPTLDPQHAGSGGARDPVAAGGGLYRTHVPTPDPLKERLLDGLDLLLRVARPTFEVDGVRYPYALHAYNRTSRSERCVELPLVAMHLRAFAGRRILEVGNVLQHYGEIVHTVIDKYESAPGVLNVDVVEYRPDVPFDLIVSISTLEHVGWDEDPRQPEGVLAAFDNLVAHCLAPGGRLVATLPVGYNTFLDDALATDRLRFDRVLHLRRLGRFARWRQCDSAAITGVRYGDPHPFANAVRVCILDKPAPVRSGV